MTIDYARICDALHNAFVPTTITDEIHYRMRVAMDQAAAGQVPAFTLVVGKPGVGKTQAVRRFAVDYPAQVLASRRSMPVVYCRLEANSSVNDLTVKLLEVMDVPISYRKTAREKRKLLHISLRNLGVRMVIFDESQQIIEQRTDRVRYQFVDELRLLVDELRIAIVLVGLPSVLEASTANVQLERRSTPPITISPFNYLESASLTGFVDLVKTYVAICEPLEFPSMVTPERIWQLYCASSANRGHLVAIFKQCVLDSQYAQRTCITLSDLAQAVDRSIYKLAPGICNPFSSEFRHGPSKTLVRAILGYRDEAERAIVEGDRRGLL